MSRKPRPPDPRGSRGSQANTPCRKFELGNAGAHCAVHCAVHLVEERQSRAVRVPRVPWPVRNLGEERQPGPDPSRKSSRNYRARVIPAHPREDIRDRLSKLVFECEIRAALVQRGQPTRRDRGVWPRL